METLALIGSALGLGLTAGIRLYTTVLAIGLGINFGWVDPGPQLSKLEILANPYILTGAGVLFLIEFFADKIPWIDTVWDAIHTLIRPVGAAIIGATAYGAVDPLVGVFILLLCGSVGFTGHASKVGTRVLANTSPEPVSNIGLSLFEDGLVIGGVWLAIEYPIIMLLLVVVFVTAFLFMLPKVIRLLKRFFRKAVGSKQNTP